MNLKKSILFTFSLFNFTANFGAEGPRVETVQFFNQTNETFDVYFPIDGERVRLRSIEPYTDLRYKKPLGRNQIIELYSREKKYYIFVDLERLIERSYTIHPSN